jgi:(p)ppGpp synthase/HD superfamily hydrolase
MLGFSPRVHAALALAAKAHRDQLRKGSDVPYLVHPVQVAMILMAHGFDEDLVLAGILHDTVEDTSTTLEELAAAFGPEVARLVDAVSEKKAEDGGEKRPWRVRKEEAIAHVGHSDGRVAALKAADALHNAASTIADVQRLGREAFTRFNAGAHDSLWYYGELARACSAQLGDHPLAHELTDTVATLVQLANSSL